ncbi:MAG: hypothetical protein ACK4U0_12630 [Mesorhizobium sp.]
MTPRTLLVLPLLLVAGCTGVAPVLDDEMVSSMNFDTMPCPELVARRDALAGAHGLPRDTDPLVPGRRPFYVLPGAGPVVPDMRTPWTRERSRAIGEVKAMDGSINRRKCRDA